MATLKKKDTAALDQGVWIKQLTGDGEEFWIQTKGYPDAYIDAQRRRQNKAAIGFGGDASQLPAALTRTINCETMAKLSFMNIDGLDEGPGQPVTADRVREILNDAELRLEYSDLVDATFTAARLAQDGIDHTREYLEKNSVRSSAAS